MAHGLIICGLQSSQLKTTMIAILLTLSFKIKKKLVTVFISAGK